MGFLQGNVRSPAHPQIYACVHSRPQGQASLVRGHDRKNNTPMQIRTRVGCGFASALCYRWPLLRTSSPLHTHAPLVAHDSQGTSCASHMRQHVTACDTRTHFRQPAKTLTFPKPETARNGASRRVDEVIDPYGAGAPLRRVCVIRCRDKHCLSAVTTFKTQYADANSYPGGLRICIGVVLSLAPAADERCSPLHTDTHLGRYTGPLLPTSGARSDTRIRTWGDTPGTFPQTSGARPYTRRRTWGDTPGPCCGRAVLALRGRLSEPGGGGCGGGGGGGRR